MPKPHPVRLTAERRELLQTRRRQGGLPARVPARIRTPLWSDDGLTDAAIAERLETPTSSVERTRKRFAVGGLNDALTERPRPGAAPVLDGKGEALPIELACSQPPEGRARWTPRQLGRKPIALEVVETVSHETVRPGAKKNDLKPWQKRSWCVPKVSGEFVWRMEEVPETYAEPHDPDRPVVCFDEAGKELHAETRARPAAPGRAAREDCTYERRGTANPFMLLCPLLGRREASVTERRTARDFAAQMVDDYFPAAKVIGVVLDNPNTPTRGSLYEAFGPAEAKRIADRLGFVYTPKHASRPNMAEPEWSVLTRQYLGRRIATAEDLRRGVEAWVKARNAAGVRITWSFRLPDARVKLAHLYPANSL